MSEHGHAVNRGVRGRVVRYALAIVTVLLPSRAAFAQAPEDQIDPPDDYVTAVRVLAEGDTASAIERLRQATAAAPRYGPAYLRLGSLLSARASEVERDFAGRQEAETVLTTALKLMGDDPEVLLEWGLLLRKQNIRVDAKRVLDRAWAAAEKRGHTFSARDRARMHYTLATIYETWWEDWQNLVWAHGVRSMITCPAATARNDPTMAAVVCPKAWWNAQEHARFLTDLKDEERLRMLEHFRLAIQADSMHTAAASRLLGHLADSGEWEAYRALSRHIARLAPNDARAQLFLALGLHHVGHSTAADSVFKKALSLLPPEERQVFHEIGLVLPRSVGDDYRSADEAKRQQISQVFFASRDPLYLTPANERRLEHFARVAWAELKFSSPTSGRRGWDSERGQIFIRYGAPELWTQCCYGAARGVRHVIWSYGPDGPNFTFERKLTYRGARLSEPSKRLADDLAVRRQEAYRPTTIPEVIDLAPQIARFRGDSAGITRVDIYASPPLDTLGAMPGTRLDAGIFVFTSDMTPIWERRHTLNVTDLPVGLSYRFDLAKGSYVYGVEARVAGPDTVPRRATRVRENLELHGFPAGRLAISDILLATGIAEREQPVRERADLVVVPRYGISVRNGEPIPIYFEVYGLTSDADGIARYRAELVVEDSTKTNIVERIARGATELFRRGGEQQTRVSWERTVQVEADGAIDYLTLELPAVAAGEYAILLRITDQASGVAAETRRRFTVRP